MLTSNEILNHSKWKTLDEDNQRILFAEVCGWEEIGWSTEEDKLRDYPEIALVGYEPDDPDYIQLGFRNEIPRFDDLEYMRYIERRLLTTVNLQSNYIRILTDISFKPDITLADGWACFAEGPERAEALVLTLKQDLI